MKGIDDYPGVSKAHLTVAKNYSSLLLVGPPICDELVALVEHMYTGEEADIVQHLKPWWPRTADSLASVTGRPLQEVKAVLERLAYEKQVILRSRSFPASIALPWGLSLGPIFHLPLPAKCTIEIGEPFKPSEIARGRADVKEKVDAVYEETIRRIQAMMDLNASNRRLPVIG